VKPVRQGDVWLERVAAIPDTAVEKPRDHGRVILAYGEVTGHAHAIDDTVEAPTATLFETPEGLAFLKVDALSQLVHEEHGSIALAPGHYRVKRQREYEPDGWRNVAD
jgi:hypothetical protein